MTRNEFFEENIGRIAAAVISNEGLVKRWARDNKSDSGEDLCNLIGVMAINTCDQLWSNLCK